MQNKITRIVGLLIITLLILPNWAQAQSQSRRNFEGRVLEVVDSQTMLVSIDGRRNVVKLACIQTPYLSQNDPKKMPWPLARGSRGTLEDLVLHKKIRIRSYIGSGTRNDPLWAQVYVPPQMDPRLRENFLGDFEELLGIEDDESFIVLEDMIVLEMDEDLIQETYENQKALEQIEKEGVQGEELWVQKEMLLKGMARVQTYVHIREFANELLGFEKAARAERRGIWDLAFYRIIEPFEARRRVNNYEIVEGFVFNVGENPRTKDVEIIFGPDQLRDFKAIVPPIRKVEFDKVGFDFNALRNQKIRVRGWIQQGTDPKTFVGPFIEISHPEVIEMVK